MVTEDYVRKIENQTRQFLLKEISNEDYRVGGTLRACGYVLGDILATGTPPGVGMGKNDSWRLETSWSGIANLGAQRHEIVV